MQPTFIVEGHKSLLMQSGALYTHLKLIIMDLVKAFNIWCSLGEDYELISWNAKDAYYSLFVKNGEVVGNTRATGNGISWDYPQELMDIADKYDERGHKIPSLWEDLSSIPEESIIPANVEYFNY